MRKSVARWVHIERRRREANPHDRCSIPRRASQAHMTYYVNPPPSANNLFFNGKKGRVKSAEYRLWQTTAGLQLNAQNAKPIAGRVDVEYSVPRNNRRDLGNFEKALSDLLVKQGIIEDDRKIERIVMRWLDNGERAHIDVWRNFIVIPAAKKRRRSA